MRSSIARRVTTVLLAQSLLLSLTFAQQTETRPRRTQSTWPQPSSSATPIISAPTLAVVTGPEPTIRVALNTDARTAVISTTGHLMNASDGGKTMLALDTSRVRVNPRLLSPLPAANDDAQFRVMVAGAASHEEAEDTGKQIQKLSSEDTQEAFDTETKTWSVVVGPKRSREEAEELRARLESEGFDATTEGPASSQPAQQQTSRDSRVVKLTSSRPNLPSREVITSGTTGPMFSSSAPVVFASDDEKNAPVRFNERPFRGRIEVFTN